MAGNALAALVTAAQQGDETAQERLLQRAAKLAYARARKLAASDDRAQDAAQEALVSALQALPRLREPTAFLPWLRTIVDNAVAAQHARRSRRREEPLSAARGLAGPDTAPAVAEQEALVAQVRRAMSVLPSRDRVAVELFYFEEMTCRQVAEFMYLTPDAVKVILHRARARLRKEITTMSAADVKETRTPRIVVTMRSGELHAPRQDLLFEHDSQTARVYIGLYPAGEAGRVAHALGLRRAEVDTELAWLAERKLVVEEGVRWRCLMPVMLDRDLAIIRPWAQHVAAPVLARLDEFHAKLLELVGDQPESPQGQTVVVVGLYAEVAGRPFKGLMGKMAPTAPDHGEWGRSAVAAVAVEKGWPDAYRGLIHISSESHPEEGSRRGPYYYCLLWPHGTDRAELVDLVQSVGEEIDTLNPERGLLGFLTSLGRSPVSRGEAASRAAEFGVRAPDFEALLSELIRLGALRADNARVALALPHAGLRQWQEFVNQVDGLEEKVAGAMADTADDLRARLLRCSFCECDFTESVYLCFSLAAGLVSEAIARREWVRFPERADFSWGVLLVS